MPLLFWALLAAGAGGLALEVARNPVQSSEAKLLASLMVVLAALFGPLAFAASLLRLCLVTVAVDPRDGLILSRRRTIPWAEIRSVEYRPAPLRGMIRANPLILFLSAGCVALICYVVIPSVVLFTPWPARVILGLSDGTRIVLRDLRRPEEFVDAVSQRLDAGRSCRPPAVS